MAGLRAELLRHEPSDEGPQAAVLFIEENGDEHQVRCLCTSATKTELAGWEDGARLRYLIDRYGDQAVIALARYVTLGGMGK